MKICGTVKKYILYVKKRERRRMWSSISKWSFFDICSTWGAVNLIINCKLSRCRHREEAGCSTGRRFKEEPGMFKHILTDQTTDIIQSAQTVRMGFTQIVLKCICWSVHSSVCRPSDIRLWGKRLSFFFFFETVQEYRLTGVMHLDSSWEAPERLQVPSLAKYCAVPPCLSLPK